MSVTFAVPHTRPFEGEFVDSLLYLYKPEYMVWDRVPNMGVSDARNELVQRFLGNPRGTEYLLFCDSDATFAPLSLMRLLDRKVDMVSACIYRRGLPPVPTFGPYYGIDQDGDHTYDFGVAADTVLQYAERAGIGPDTANALVLPSTTPPTEQDLYEVGGCGLHFCLINRRIFEEIRPPWFKGKAGEDFYFCRKVTGAGYKIHVDLSVHTGHIVGPGIDFGIRELIAWYEKHEREPELWAA